MFLINLPIVILLFATGLEPAPRVLIFGDSLTHHGEDNSPEMYDVKEDDSAEQPGDILGHLLVKRGYQVRLDANVGRSFYNFWKAPGGRQYHSADDLIKADLDFQPNMVIIMLGTNDLGLGAKLDLDAMIRLRDVFEGIEIIVVGPPTYVYDNDNYHAKQVYKSLDDVFNRVIDARPISSKSGRTKDGQHFGLGAATDFAGQLYSNIVN